MTSEPEEELDLSAGMVPHHPLGPITGWSHDDGLPIVKRQSAAEKPESSEAPAKRHADERPEAKPVENATDSAKPMARPMLKPATNPDLEKGRPVELADGSRAKVAHVIQNMRSVRVRTEDGRNVTVGRGTLKVPDSVFVRQHFRRAPD
jgi:hypothetical protein